MGWLMASGATVVTNARQIAADDFFDGLFATNLDEGEIITEVRFPVPEAAHYEKFLQPASRFALVGVFVAKFADGVRVAVTGASPTLPSLTAPAKVPAMAESSLVPVIVTVICWVLPSVAV